MKTPTNIERFTKAVENGKFTFNLVTLKINNNNGYTRKTI